MRLPCSSSAFIDYKLNIGPYKKRNTQTAISFFSKLTKNSITPTNDESYEDYICRSAVFFDMGNIQKLSKEINQMYMDSILKPKSLEGLPKSVKKRILYALMDWNENKQKYINTINRFVIPYRKLTKEWESMTESKQTIARAEYTRKVKLLNFNFGKELGRFKSSYQEMLFSKKVIKFLDSSKISETDKIKLAQLLKCEEGAL